MMQAVLYIMVIIALVGWPSSLYLLFQVRRTPLTAVRQVLIATCFVTAAALSLTIWLTSMRAGVRALERMSA